MVHYDSNSSSCLGPKQQKMVPSDNKNLETTKTLKFFY